MSKATAAAPRLNASEAVAGRPPTRQSQPTPDCRAATFQNLVYPLRGTSAATIMPLPRPRIPHPDCRWLLSRLPRYTQVKLAPELLNCASPIGSCRRLQCCEATAEERWCGKSARHVLWEPGARAASGDPVDVETEPRPDQ